MKLPATNCPQCNSLQKFPRKSRIAQGEIEIFIRCLMCRWEEVVETTLISEAPKRNAALRERNRLIRRLR